ncbi:Acyl-CoA dehydrogenase [Haloechinothrix alba]|uniref:Acyl-CoA dehydrogenase n=1 Tax=Haloechinothrix alba TaxID=664784 RepID=A0A239AHF8_9PSEU|nr:acyl-CoA dehydrogenase family protein [Haloechinothrix alba]SNR94373.1 Acyl-CoA dehydrogenase [Haloechinothrix alba]
MSVDSVQRTLSLEDFRAEAEAFLEASVSAVRTDHGQFEFDDTEDRVTLFRGATAEEAQRARDWQRRVYDAGFGWITGPVDLGGAGLPARFEQAYLETERRYPVPSRSPLGVSLGMVFPTLLNFGTEQVKQRWLLPLRRADVVGCQLFSEPGAGSDLASVSTRAKRTESGDWLVTGEKVWTSGAHYSDVGLLLARSSEGSRHRNLTAFVVDMHAAGVEVRSLRQMTGGADFNEVFLDGVAIPDENRLGDIDDGWRVALATLMYERGAIGGATAGGSGLFRLDRIIAWLHELGCERDPAVRQAFARVHAGLTAAKAMRARAEAAVKAGTTPGPEMSLSKLALTSNLASLSDLVGVALGPRLLADTGERDAYSWSEFVLGVPGMRLGGGSDEIQRDIIAHRVLGLPKGPG